MDVHAPPRVRTYSQGSRNQNILNTAEDRDNTSADMTGDQDHGHRPRIIQARRNCVQPEMGSGPVGRPLRGSLKDSARRKTTPYIMPRAHVCRSASSRLTPAMYNVLPQLNLSQRYAVWKRREEIESHRIDTPQAQGLDGRLV